MITKTVDAIIAEARKLGMGGLALIQLRPILYSKLEDLDREAFKRGWDECFADADGD